MGRTSSDRARLIAIALAAAVASCGDDQDPGRATDLWSRVQEGGGYRAWEHAPRYPFRMASNTAHGSEVEVFVNPPLAQAIGGKPATAWPDGSIIVKDIYSRRSLSHVAVMEKRGGKWFWAEYDAGGDPIFSGEPAICVDCHRPRQKTSDWLYTVELPR